MEKFIEDWSQKLNINLKKVNQDTYISQLGVDSMLLIEMISELEEIHDIEIYAESLYELRVKDLKDIKKFLNEQDK